MNQLALKFEVTDIDQIVFEYQDGSETNFSELFEYRTSIGAGGFGYVVAALDKETGEEIALKLLRKDDAPQAIIDMFKKEAEILKSIHDQSSNSPLKFKDASPTFRSCTYINNIIGFRFFKEFSNYLCLGMELCTGGNLTDWISEQKLMKGKSEKQHEEDCAVIIKNILQGLRYIHDRHEIIHRDLKPGNILFLRKNDLNSLKICDFGLANQVGVGFFDQNEDNAGTLIYQAPEQMKSSSYGKKIDIWATGLIMYELLTKGGHPLLGIDFYNNLEMSIAEYKEKILNITSSDKVVKQHPSLSSLAFKLLENMLNVNPNLRYSSNRALKHPWVTRDVNAKIPLNMYEEMQLNMNAYEKLKLAQKVAFAVSLLKQTVIKQQESTHVR